MAKSRFVIQVKEHSNSEWVTTPGVSNLDCRDMKLGPGEKFFAVRIVNTAIRRTVYMRDDQLAHHYRRSSDTLVCTSPPITRVSIADEVPATEAT